MARKSYTGTKVVRGRPVPGVSALGAAEAATGQGIAGRSSSGSGKAVNAKPPAVRPGKLSATAKAGQLGGTTVVANGSDSASPVVGIVPTKAALDAMAAELAAVTPDPDI